MKKILLILLSVLLLSSCAKNMKERDGHTKRLIYSGYKWDIIMINDSICIAVPGLNSDKSLTPIMYNSKRSCTPLKKF